jgi:hypothetical protein
VMLDSLTPTRRLAVLGGAVGSLLLLVLIAVFSFTGGAGRSSTRGGEPARGALATTAAAGVSAPSLNPSQSSAVERGIADLRAFPTVTPSTSTRYPAIPAARETLWGAISLLCL